MPREASIGRRIERVLDTRGAWWIKTCPPLPVGTPDYLACYRGHFIAIEAKAPGGRTRRIQDVRAQQIRSAGGIAIVAYDPAQVEQALDRIDEQMRSRPC